MNDWTILVKMPLLTTGSTPVEFLLDLILWVLQMECNMAHSQSFGMFLLVPDFQSFLWDKRVAF